MNAFHDLPSPNLVDLAAVVLVILAALRGMLRGLSGELAALVGAGAGLLLGLMAYAPCADWLVKQAHMSERAALTASFGVIVIGAIMLFLVVRWAMGKVMHVVVEPGPDRACGIVAGLLHGLVLVVIVFVLLNLAPNAELNRLFGSESFVGTLVHRAAPDLRGLAEGGGAAASDVLTDVEDVVDAAREKIDESVADLREGKEPRTRKRGK